MRFKDATLVKLNIINQVFPPLSTTQQGADMTCHHNNILIYESHRT